ncbi:hypothetical protein [Gryllotalpicola koreensis]|uniref:Uncharacterized protein n=1 Tax=Gryllotalpicola koreensis TaxID=993086 RepID=A0ABP8A1M6_9MICO
MSLVDNRRNAKVSRAQNAQQITGIVQAVTSTGYMVIVGGSNIPVFGMGYIATPGEQVRLLFINQATYLVGPASIYPTSGVVASVQTNTVTLSVTGAPVPWADPSGTLTCAFVSATTPSVGQTMLILWSGGPTAFGYSGTAPSAPSGPSAPPAPAPSTHVDTFTAVSAGSYSQTYGDWFNSEVWASSTCLGCWFYGTKIADTIPSSAANGSSKVELYLSVKQKQGSNPNLAIHNYTSRPGGAPSLTTVETFGITSGWFTVETGNSHGIFSSLKAGGNQRGLGMQHGGYNIFNSPTVDGLSGAIRITSTY